MSQQQKALEASAGATKYVSFLVTSPSFTLIAGTLGQSKPGVLHAVTINQISNPTFSIVDGTTFPAAQILYAVPNATTESYILDAAFSTGLSILATNLGQAPKITVTYRLD